MYKRQELVSYRNKGVENFRRFLGTRSVLVQILTGSRNLQSLHLDKVVDCLLYTSDSLLLKPFGTSKIGVVCSKNQSRLKYNRQLEDGSTIRGRFLVCGLSESKMLGLSKEQAERYNRLLFFPQVEDMLSGDLPVAKVRPPDERFGSKISFWERLSR